MNEFEITVDKNNGTKGVSCVKRQLYMKRIEEDAIMPDMLVIAANLGNIFDDSKQVYLQILYTGLDRDFKKWDMDLFLDAAEYFCQVELDSEPTGFSTIPTQNFYPYEKGDVIY